MEEHVDVAVVGAGFAGLALASLCADAGMSVVVLERRPALAPEGVGLVLQPNGLAVLDRLGVVDEVVETGQRITEGRQCDPSGRVRACASYAELDHPHPYIVTVERTKVIGILAGRLPPGASLRTGCTATSLDGTTLHYRDADGEPRALTAACVVGADGRNSVIRQQLGSRSRWVTGPDRYVIGIAPVPPPHDAAVLYCGRGWCDGVLPYGDQTYFFDHVVDDSAAAVDAGDFDAWREVLAARVAYGAAIAESLDSFEDVGFLSGRTHRSLPRVGPGIALIGDAAQAVHPHNGQGANLALEDALCLGDLLTKHGPSSETVLREFAKRRDAKARRQVPYSILIGRIFDGPNPAWRALRTFGYQLAKIPTVRHQTTRRQAGLG
ncbi:MAG TPA: NAD(P)/FAD-dependent oxidoreductase [Solirubrobacteraceae bacterium]